MYIKKECVKDGDFESASNSEWVVSGSTQIQYEEAGGNNYCCINNTASIMQFVDLEPNKTYTLTYQCRGKGKGSVYVMNMHSKQYICYQALNTACSEEWYTEQWEFTTLQDVTSLRLHFETLWDDAGNTIDVDNIQLESVEFEYHTPETIDVKWDGTTPGIYKVVNRQNVVDQHNVLYVNGQLVCDFGVTVAGQTYSSPNIFSGADINSVFSLRAIDDNTGIEYIVYDCAGSALFGAGYITPADI